VRVISLLPSILPHKDHYKTQFIQRRTPSDPKSRVRVRVGVEWKDGEWLNGEGMPICSALTYRGQSLCERVVRRSGFRCVYHKNLGEGLCVDGEDARLLWEEGKC